MCGIAGILAFNNHKLPFENIEPMTRSMKHRGPDDEGFAFFSGAESKVSIFGGNDTPKTVLDAGLSYTPRAVRAESIPANTHLTLGHRRLSILDLSPAGHQPLSTDDGRYWIVHNGEIYNFETIRKELENQGLHFSSNTDTELILKAYAVWGPECLKKFNGMWAFAIWDTKKKTLFCARDRIGIKPFYYMIHNQTFLFGSDIKSIIASGLYRPKPNMEGLYLAMAFGIAPRPRTAFANVYALEQAHWMRVHIDGHIENQRYWAIPVGTQKSNMGELEATEMLEERLKASIERRLVSDVPVGTFMSGGIDSTTISAIASDFQPGIKAFTLAYKDVPPDRNEVHQAVATASMHPLDHIVHWVDPVAPDDLHSRIAGYEEPCHGLSANYIISQLARDNGVKVVLNGLGGDELFAGYGWYSRIRFWRFTHGFAPLLSRIPLIYGKRRLRLLSMCAAKSADRFHTTQLAITMDAELHELFSDPNLKHINTPDILHEMYVGDLEFGDDLEAVSYMDIMNYIGNHHVHRSDQFTMAHSIEGRFPLLDHELVEAAFQIPSHLKKRGRQQKYILRKVAQKHIAPECLAMKKKGFALPVEQWLRGPLKPILEKKLQSLEKRAEICDGIPAKWFRQYQAGAKSPHQIWHLAALELWFETFIDRYEKAP